MNSYQNMLLNDGNIAESDYLACSGINENHDEYFGAVAPPIIQTSLLCRRITSSIVMICVTKPSVTYTVAA